MAMSHGSQARIYVSAYDLSGFLRSVSSDLSRDTAETTTFGVQDKTYVLGLREGTVSLEGYYVADADTYEPVWSAAFSAPQTLITVCPQGDGFGLPAYAVVGPATAFKPETSVDDVAQLSAECQANQGRERLLIHHALAARTASGQSSALDGGAASPGGGVGVLQVTDLSGVTLSATIQDSADGTAWATILTFASVAAARVWQRVPITGTVRRYTRTTWTLTGTGSATFWVGFGRF